MELRNMPAGTIGNRIGDWSLQEEIRQITIASTAQYFYYTEGHKEALEYEDTLPSIIDAAGDNPPQYLTYEEKIDRIRIINQNIRDKAQLVPVQPKARKLIRGKAEWMDEWLQTLNENS